MTYELDSGVDEDSCDDMPVLFRFNEEEPMTKDFTFKVGMDFFLSEAIQKGYTIVQCLNGKEVRFAKNDSMRCRIISKHKKLCNYNVLCNKVIRSTTFKFNTLFHKHKCGRLGKKNCSCNYWDLIGNLESHVDIVLLQYIGRLMIQSSM